MEKLINSINYVEYSNKIEKILFEFLYSTQNGYTNLKSKNAIENVQKYLEKFDLELDKLNNQYQIKNNDKLAFNIRKDYIRELKKHYEKSVEEWLDVTFEEKIENILFKVSLNKNNLTIIDSSYNKLLCLIGWYSKAKEYNLDEEKMLISKINKKFKNALRENFKNLLPKQNPQNSNENVYFKLRHVLRNSKDDFLKLDVNDFVEELTKEDLSYFNIAKQLVLNNDIGRLYDEIDLIDASFEIAQIKDEKEKYNFLKQIKNDFKNFKNENKTLKEEDKVQIIKRRIAILKEGKSSKNNCKYFKTILST